MYINEEYLKRHGLTCPIIKRPNKDENLYCLFKRKSNKTNVEITPRGIRSPYMRLSIELVYESHVPPYYYFKWSHPTHSGRISRIFDATHSEKIEWDGYEDYIRQLNCYDQTIVSDRDEVKCALWEILLYHMDDMFSCVQYSLKEQIWQTLDISLEKDKRISKIDACIYKLKKNPNMNGDYFQACWENLVKESKESIYCDWIAKIFKNEEIASNLF